MMKSLYGGNPMSQSGLYVKRIISMESHPDNAKCLVKVIFWLNGSQALASMKSIARVAGK
jgi:hypothetical protein